MSKQRPSEDPRQPSFFKRVWWWFGELPPSVRVPGILVLVLGIILAILPSSLFHSFNCPVQNLPQSYFSSNGYFIDNQVIVVGPAKDVDAVIGTPTSAPPTTQVPPTTSIPSIPSKTPTTPPPVTAETLFALATPTATGTPPVVPTTPTPAPSNKVILNLIESCDLSYLNSRKNVSSKATVEPRQLVMRLYEIPATETPETGIPEKSNVENVIDRINIAARGNATNNLAPTYDVSADPNYLTRLSDVSTDPCGKPADGTGGGGHPFGAFGIADPQTAKEAFMRQWAFSGLHGINFTNSSISLTGQGVLVGVFDTSPYRIHLPFYKRIWAALPPPLSFTNWDTGGNTMVSNHGLFVAELIHGMAPKSSIQLIRVLNEDGCGELWSLNKGLEDFKSRMSALSGDLDDTVINMSLGIRLKPEAEENDTGSNENDSGSAENDYGPEDEATNTTSEANDVEKEDLETFKKLINEANDMGAIIIAAAGNDSPLTDASGHVIADPAPMEIPASYDNVLGVGATNMKGDRSCYSNTGDVTAPGGDGGKLDVPQPDGTVKHLTCEPRSATWDQDPPPNDRTVKCDDVKDCPFGVISLVQTRYGPQYMIWSGTSFAAPLVSGLAALAYEKNTHDQAICIIKKEQIKNQPRPDLPEGWGPIDLNDNLSPRVISKCQTFYPSAED